MPAVMMSGPSITEGTHAIVLEIAAHGCLERSRKVMHYTTAVPICSKSLRLTEITFTTRPSARAPEPMRAANVSLAAAVQIFSMPQSRGFKAWPRVRVGHLGE